MKRIRRHVRQGLGKVRRFANGALRQGHVARKLRRRQGECIRCGTCCKLLFKCPFLEELHDGSTRCLIHDKRPQNCRIFPVDERCIEERNLLLPGVPCGYTFADTDEDTDEKTDSASLVSCGDGASTGMDI
ncbi:MAG: hypothetical protein KGY81_10415 [Phycisphaerae bacterium]|jgi:Fe-S-cluster containining protein|nr:hypothetical protein [Phycisphaerae bacterium]